MSQIRLYPKVEVKGQDFTGSKIYAVPSQSLTLHEIIRRFVRREAIPHTREDALYAENLGDLEKLSKEDITVQMERAQELKENIATAKKRMKKIEDEAIQKEIERKANDALAAQKAAENGSGSKSTDPSGTT